MPCRYLFFMYLCGMEKIRIGIVGTNFVSDWMADGGRLDPRCGLTAVFSRHEDTGHAFAQKHGIPAVFTSLEAMVRSGLVDAVYIASPNSCHCSQALVCMDAGLHVLCEKPMASNAAEVTAMAEAARRSGVVLLEAMIPALSPVLAAVAANMPRIGTVRRYFASYCQYSSRYDRFKRGDIANAFRPELSNGAVMDIGVYCLYPMVALFGAPQDVYASALRLSTGVDGQGTVVAQYDGFDGVAIYSKIADSALPAEIQGEEGTITIDRISSPRRSVFTPRDKSAPAEVLAELSSADDPYFHEMRAFIDLIEQGGEHPLSNLRNSLATISLIDELRRRSSIIFPADL